MNTFLDTIPLIFYFIAGAIAISYQTYFGIYQFKPSKKINILCVASVILFGTLAIVSSILFWYYI